MSKIEISVDTTEEDVSLLKKWRFDDISFATIHLDDENGNYVHAFNTYSNGFAFNIDGVEVRLNHVAAIRLVQQINVLMEANENEDDDDES